MSKTVAAVITAIGALSGVGGFVAKKEFDKFIKVAENKQKLIDEGDVLVQKIVGKLAHAVPVKYVPYINRYDNKGFMEGSGYFLKAPAENAVWKMGYSKNSVVPYKIDGDCYIAGYLAFPPNKMQGIIQEQMCRAYAFDDGSGRGVNVWAVIDCIGISNTDIRDIRNRLSDLIPEKNILSINISATHCHSGIDTCGLWGDLVAALKTNVKALKKNKPEDCISGKNKMFMEYFKDSAANTIREAVENMTEGKLYYSQMPIEKFVHDKRPPDVIVDKATVLKFVPADGSKQSLAVFMAAHPTCYGDKQKDAICDFPRFMCNRIEENGFNAAFFQGAELAIATDRGGYAPEDATNEEGIQAYGEALGDYILSGNDFTELKPLLNVAVSELFLPNSNNILELACRMRVVNNNMVKVTMSDERNAKDFELRFASEVGFANFGNALTFVMAPGEMEPELVVGGFLTPEISYDGNAWELPSLAEFFGGDIAAIGLCNDFVGYIIADNNFGSMFAPLHYEESISAGKHTASNIVNAIINLKNKTEKTAIYPGENKEV